MADVNIKSLKNLAVDEGVGNVAPVGGDALLAEQADGNPKWFDINALQGAIDHDSLSGVVAAEHIDWSVTGVEDVHDDRIAQTSVTQHEAAINHDALTNFAVNEHVDHTTVNIIAGAGLTGGGDISGNRTLNANVKNSVEVDLDALQLVNDQSAPGANQVYGTDGSGIKGWKADPTGEGSSPPFSDTTSIVEGSADGTKELRFEVDGFTTATVRVITPADRNWSPTVFGEELTEVADAAGARTKIDAAQTSHTHAASDVTSGTFADARISESSVTQHEAAIDHDALTNFAVNEHRIILTGTLANRPAAGTDDRFFWATDTNQWFHDDGVAWNEVNAADAATLEGNDSAFHLARANHTGTQLLNTISDSGDLAALDTVDEPQLDDQSVSGRKWRYQTANKGTADATDENLAASDALQVRLVNKTGDFDLNTFAAPTGWGRILVNDTNHTLTLKSELDVAITTMPSKRWGFLFRFGSGDTDWAIDVDARLAETFGVLAAAGAKNSIEIDADDAQLVGDQASPGPDQVYGTDGSGVKGWKADPAGGGGGSLDYDRIDWDSDVDGATLNAAQGNWYLVSGAATLTVNWDGANVADERTAVVEKLSGGPTINHEAAATFTLNGAASPGTDEQKNSIVFVVRDGSDFIASALEAAEQRERFDFFDTVGFNDQVAERPELKDYAETSTTPSSSANALTLDLETGNVFEVTLTEDVTTLNLDNPPPTGKAGSILIIIRQDATGGWSITWPASVEWPGGTAPTLTGTANSVDIVSLVTRDGGTTWYGFEGGLNFS